jgi:phosphoribosylaminoimidazolecarboxamide formyltransferase/IMP cyclohydrolase
MPRAILSVSDKTGLTDLASWLLLMGWKLYATSETARALRKAGLTVTDVAEYTATPEALDGQVRAAHPAILAGLLARDTLADRAALHERGWEFFDLAAINLPPFEEAISQPGLSMEAALESLDTDGVALMRAAAKNAERVTLLTDPADYRAVLGELESGGVRAETRRRLAAKGFALTSRYDAVAAAYFGLHAVSAYPAAGQQPLDLRLYPVQKLRYGENPHQSATLYSFQPGVGPLGGQILQGRELSYTNLLDLDTSWRLVTRFDRPTVCIMRQTSPCGAASAETLTLAFKAALATDPISAYGAVVASNRVMDADTVRAMSGVFIECVIAPGYTEEARELLSKRKRCRIVLMPDMVIEPKFELRSIARGVLKQEVDFGDPAGSAAWRVVSERQPSEDEWTALRFGWKVSTFSRSNAIVLAKGEATVGIGSGQPNRVDCVRVALMRATERAQGSAMASDAFFPFPDSIEVAAQAGITAIVHPGGSVRDQDSIDAADAHGMAMVLTGVRHFRH